MTWNRIGRLAVLPLATLTAMLTLAVPSGLAGRPDSTTGHPHFRVKVTGQGRPVILIPGLTCNGSVWKVTVDQLKDRYQVHILSLAGFGGTPAVDGPLLASVRSELAQYIRHQKLQKPTIVGHSLGGMLALWLASEHPALVGSVIAVDGVPFLPALQQPDATVESTRESARRLAEFFATLEADTFAKQNEMTLSMMVRDAKTATRLAEMASQSDPRTVGQAFAELMTNDLRKKIGAIEVPVLVIAPAEPAMPGLSADVVQQRYRDQFKEIRHCRLEFWPNVRHFVMFDAPQRFHTVISQFLSDPASYVASGTQAGGNDDE